MTHNDLTFLLLRRCAAARNPFRRFLLNLHVRRQWLRAQWLAHAATAAKRALDIVGAAILLLLSTPLLFVIAMFIKIEDGGPIFFQQVRGRPQWAGNSKCSRSARWPWAPNRAWRKCLLKTSTAKA